MRDTATVEGGQTATLAPEPAGNDGAAQGKGHATANQRAATALQGRLLQSPGAVPPWQASDPKLLGGTLAELDAYTYDHPDWIVAEQARPTGSALWQLVSFMRANTTVSSALGTFTVHELLLHHILDSSGAALRRYALAVGDSGTSVDLQPAPTLAKALTYGAALLKLDAGMPGSVQADVIKQSSSGSEYGDCLDLLMAQPGLLDGFVKYVQVVKPVLSATNGADVAGFIAFSKDVGGDVTRYASRLKHVRTHHHFEIDALEQLAANEKDVSKSRPLTVVLHSAEDHNGAFMRAPSMTAVICDRRSNVIVIEGVASLAEVGGQLTAVAAQYGQGGKVDQVMIAGHGEARNMGLGASRDKDGVLQHDWIDLDGNAPASDKLLATVVASMSPTAPHRRILLEACLTNSNTLASDTVATMTQDPKLTREKVGAVLDQNESLAAHVQRMATAGKTNAQAIGANGEIYSGGSAKFSDPATGALTLSDASDPAMISDKLEYVRTGTDPDGALRALLQSWTKDPDATRVAVEGRVALPPSDRWQDNVIVCIYRRALARWTDPQHFVALPGAADVLNEMSWDQAIDPGSVGMSVPLDERAAIFGELSRTSTWQASPFIRIVALQLWAEVDASKVPSLLALIGASYDAQKMAPYLYLNGTVSERLLAGAGDMHGKLVYASVAAMLTTPDQNAVAFLRSHRVNGRFPTSLGMARALGGFASETQLDSAIDGGTTGVLAPAPNVALTAQGTPSVYVMPDAYDVVANQDCPLLAQPAADAHVVGTLANGAQAHCFGEAGDKNSYCAVAVKGRTEPAFVLKSAVAMAG